MKKKKKKKKVTQPVTQVKILKNKQKYQLKSLEVQVMNRLVCMSSESEKVREKHEKGQRGLKLKVKSGGVFG